jgi:catechol-2,3-dioxygenase
MEGMSETEAFPGGGGRGDAAARVGRLAFVELETPDPDRLVDYYREVLAFQLVERTPDRAYLTTGPEHHCVVIAKGDSARGRSRLGLQVRPPLEDAARRLRDRGVPAERRGDSEPGLPDALVVREPGGTPLCLFAAADGSGAGSALGVRPVKLGHVAGYTDRLAEVQDFYQRHLGFRWSDTIGDFFVFLRCGPDHHTVNFIASQRLAGMHHVAYEMRDLMHLKEMLDHLAAHGYALEWGPGRHGPGHNLFTYHRDPDGNLTELFTELDLCYDEDDPHWEPRPWHETFPMGPMVWDPTPATANRWGPLSPDLVPR